MKPNKNRVKCYACGRVKMLFNSKEEAERFIKFNAAEILEKNGKAPIRAYYCKHCLGWHVTSKVSLATNMLDDVDLHLAKLKKYIRKNDACKAKMEYQKAYRFLSDAAHYKGEDLRKQVAISDLFYYNEWFTQQFAA